MGTLIGVAAFIALLGAAGYWATQQEKKRTLAMRGAAERLGWRFTETADSGIIPGLERFELFSQGRNREIRNFIAGEKDGHPAAVFDYQYVIGGGKSQQTWRQTVFHVHSPRLGFPRFAVRPEHVFHKIGGLFGYQDIDLQGYPEFSGRYLLRGADEPAIRAVFDSGVVEFYEKNPRSCTEAEGPRLFFWRAGKLVNAEEIPSFIDQGMALVSRCASGAAAPGGASA